MAVEVCEVLPEAYVLVTLAVNRGSREVTLLVYLPIFIPDGLFNFSVPAIHRKYSPGWVNPNLDLFYIRSPSIAMEPTISDSLVEPYQDLSTGWSRWNEGARGSVLVSSSSPAAS